MRNVPAAAGQTGSPSGAGAGNTAASHSQAEGKPRGAGTGNTAASHRHAPDHTPERAAGIHAPRAQTGNNDTGANTATGNPAPTASATANQVPAPPPTTRARSTAAPHCGRQTAGHGPDGNATNPEPAPDATAAARTNRDRAANAACAAEAGTHTTEAPEAADAAAHDPAGTGATAKMPSRAA